MLKKIGLMVILSVIALALILAGLGFFISSLYLYLETVLHNPIFAAIASGLAFLALAILLFLLVLLIKASLFKFHQPKFEKIKAIKENPGGEALHLIQEHPYGSAFVAVASGFVLGLFPKLRNRLIDGVATYMQTGSVADTLKSMKSDE